ncbi:hypothetical protein [uncultured Paludibaculum sp.]|uniref:hypothetical protein n=1 Tax=uncultured Paludibaculum sp. TaxID=1765020 RepID=UPI002AAA9706|nr:hypothetical protein [uncultured Paludibaculum sp.]
MTCAERAIGCKQARLAAGARKRAAGMLGQQVRNAGTALVLGEEWDTSDGFRVRQVAVAANPAEPGHLFGQLEVIGVASHFA